MAKTVSVRAGAKELEQDQQQGPWRSLRILLPVWLRQRSIFESRKVAPSHAAIGGTSGSTCGPGRDRSGEFPFSRFLMPISLEKSTASRKILLPDRCFHEGGSHADLFAFQATFAVGKRDSSMCAAQRSHRCITWSR